MGMARKQTTTYILYKREQYCFAFVLALLLSAIAAYIYFVSASVVHVVMRKEVDQEMIITSSHISELESKYIALQHSVSERMATQNGFVAVRDKLYIDRAPSSLVLSSRQSER